MRKFLLAVLLSLMVLPVFGQRDPINPPTTTPVVPDCQSPLPTLCPSDHYVCWLATDIITRCEVGVGWTSHAAGSGGGDQVAINGGSTVDPDFVSTGDIAFTNTSDTITADISPNSVSADELNATGVEDELENVLDLNQLQGTVTEAQVPLATSSSALEADGVDNIGEIADALMTGASNAVTLVSGTATTGMCGQFDANGNLVSSGAACGAGPGGVGDVVGPASATDEAFARFDTETGELLQNSVVTADNSGNVVTAGSVQMGAATVKSTKPTLLLDDSTHNDGTPEVRFEHNTATDDYGDMNIAMENGTFGVYSVLWRMYTTPGNGPFVQIGVAGSIDELQVSTDSTGDSEVQLPADSIGAAEIDSTTGAYDFGGVTSFEIPNTNEAGKPASCTVGDLLVTTDGDTNGELYICNPTNTWKPVDDDGSEGGGGTVTDVFSCAGPDCNNISMDAGDFLNMSGTDGSSLTAGLKLPQHATECATGFGEGNVCWDVDSNILYIGDSAAYKAFLPSTAFSVDATVSPTGVVTVADDSHAHGTTSIGGLDASADTNISATSPITWTAGTDAVGFDATANFAWTGTHDFDAGVAVKDQTFVTFWDSDSTNYVRMQAKASLDSNWDCVFEDDLNFIPDTCVGNGTDDIDDADADPTQEINLFSGDGGSPTDKVAVLLQGGAGIATSCDGDATCSIAADLGDSIVPDEISVQPGLSEDGLCLGYLHGGTTWQWLTCSGGTGQFSRSGTILFPATPGDDIGNDVDGSFWSVTAEGVATFVSVTTSPTITPTVGFDDSNDSVDGVNDANIVVNCPDTDNCDMAFNADSSAALPGSRLSETFRIDTKSDGQQNIIIAQDVGLEFTATDFSPDDCTFMETAETNGAIFFDNSDNVFKKCQNNILTSLDSGASPGFDDVLAGTSTAALVVGASGSLVATGTGTIVATGVDAVGAAAITIGSGDVTSVTVTTAGTGDAEVVLPAGSIGSSEILDNTVSFSDTFYITYPADPVMLVDECALAKTGSGGGFLCEGSVAGDALETFFKFPDINEDATYDICTSSTVGCDLTAAANTFAVLESEITFDTNDGSRHDHHDADIPDTITVNTAAVANALSAGGLDATTEISSGMCSAGQIIENQGATWECIATPASGGSHDILSTTHEDSTTATVVRGDVMVGTTATPVWDRLALGNSAEVLKSDGTDVSWGLVTENGLAADLVFDEGDSLNFKTQVLNGLAEGIIVNNSANCGAITGLTEGTICYDTALDVICTANQTGAPICPAGGGDMLAATYDAGGTAGIVDQAEGFVLDTTPAPAVDGHIFLDTNGIDGAPSLYTDPVLVMDAGAATKYLYPSEELGGPPHNNAVRVFNNTSHVLEWKKLPISALDDPATGADTDLTFLNAQDIKLTSTHDTGVVDFFTIDVNQTQDGDGGDDYIAFRINAVSESVDSLDELEGILINQENGAANKAMKSGMRITSDETTVNMLTDAIIIDAGTTGVITDGIDVSSTGIEFSLNVGANPIRSNTDVIIDLDDDVDVSDEQFQIRDDADVVLFSVSENGGVTVGALAADSVNADAITMSTNEVLTLGTATIKYDGTNVLFNDSPRLDLGILKMDEAASANPKLGGTTQLRGKFVSDSDLVTSELVFTDDEGADYPLSMPIKSMYWPGMSFEVDGVGCATPASVEIDGAGGPNVWTTICASEITDGTIEGQVVLPDGYVDASTFVFEITYVQTTSSTGSVNGSVKAMCRGDGDDIGTTWSTGFTINEASTTGSGAINTDESAAVTPNGSCIGGDTLFWAYTNDASATSSTQASLHFLGMKMEYTWSAGDEK